MVKLVHALKLSDGTPGRRLTEHAANCGIARPTIDFILDHADRRIAIPYGTTAVGISPSCAARLLTAGHPLDDVERAVGGVVVMRNRDGVILTALWLPLRDFS